MMVVVMPWPQPHVDCAMALVAIVLRTCSRGRRPERHRKHVWRRWGEAVLKVVRAVARRLRSLGGRRLTPNAAETSRNYYGLDQLDEKLEPYVDFDNGIFVEAGANDGQTQSNTAYFARHRGWRGLLVEPIPELAGRCRLARPESIVENCALVASDADGQSVPMTYCGLMSVVDGGWSDPEAERAHVETGRQIQSLTTYRIDVPGRSLSALLDQHGIERVDLLSLDVEGFERQALEGLDLARHRPRFHSGGSPLPRRNRRPVAASLRSYRSAIASRRALSSSGDLKGVAQLRVLILNTDYEAFLDDLYAENPGLAERRYDEQMAVRNASLFGAADFYSEGLKANGVEAADIHLNNRSMQLRWAASTA